MLAFTWKLQVHKYLPRNLPRLFFVPFFLAVISSCCIFFSRKSCFLVSISSVSRSLWMASWAVGPPRERWCLDFEELDEELELELPLKNFEILLIFSRFSVFPTRARALSNCADFVFALLHSVPRDRCVRGGFSCLAAPWILFKATNECIFATPFTISSVT